MAIEDFDQVTIAPAKLRPFSKFIMSIGELPTSYLDSLSYAEQVTWFCDYLQNHVIPTINNNAEALQELETLITQLQEYVSNYFDNLDVQEEINNKLDEMAEDGTLEAIVSKYFNIPQICGATYISGETNDILNSYQAFYNIGGRKAQIVQNVTLNVGTKAWTAGDTEKLQTIISGVKEIGFINIMVKIHMSVTNGSISSLNVTELNTVLTNYQEILETYALLCETNDIDSFIITNENPYLTTHEELLTTWNSIYTSLRSIYHGLISHSMTIEESKNFKLYNNEDFISFNIYPNLSYDPNASTYECMSSKDLNENIVQIENIKNMYAKDIVITETGCEHQYGRLANPGFFGTNTQLSYQTQFTFYQTILKAIKYNLSYIKDVYLWEICYSFNFLDNSSVIDLLEAYMEGDDI